MIDELSLLFENYLYSKLNFPQPVFQVGFKHLIKVVMTFNIIKVCSYTIILMKKYFLVKKAFYTTFTLQKFIKLNNPRSISKARFFATKKFQQKRSSSSDQTSQRKAESKQAVEEGERATYKVT